MEINGPKQRSQQLRYRLHTTHKIVRLNHIQVNKSNVSTKIYSVSLSCVAAVVIVVVDDDVENGINQNPCEFGLCVITLVCRYGTEKEHPDENDIYNRQYFFYFFMCSIHCEHLSSVFFFCEHVE